MKPFRLFSTLMVFLMFLNLSFAQNVIHWDFEKGNDHGFKLWSLIPAIPAPDDPTTAGDEALTGVGGDDGLPFAGIAWDIGVPNKYDGQFPAFVEGSNIDTAGKLLYAGNNDPFYIWDKTNPDSLVNRGWVNGRGQSSYLGTYFANQWGDNLHDASNDQIATSKPVLLEEGAELIVWSFGFTTASWAGTRIAPVFDSIGYADEAYQTGSGGIAVLDENGTFLTSLLIASEGGDTNMPAADTLDLSAYAGQKVIIEVVDAISGGWGWVMVDEIMISNATVPRDPNTVYWDFEDGNDHGFELTSFYPGIPAPDDPLTAGDEALTGVGGDDGLPFSGLAWTIGTFNQYEGQFPAFEEGSNLNAETGLLEYAGANDPFSAWDKTTDPWTFNGVVNGRGQSGYLNTYNLSQWGDNLHDALNDQIAKSLPVTLNDNAKLTIWAFGNTDASWAGTRIAPEFDSLGFDVEGYRSGSGGVAVLSSDRSEILTSLFVFAQGGDGNMPKKMELDLSALAGRTVIIDVVDAFAGGWGWLAVDEIQIENASWNDPSSVERTDNSVPNNYNLDQNYPNPFNPSTKISFNIPENGLTTLSIYNVLGQKVSTLVSEKLNAGSYEVDFNASNLTSGVYFYKLESGKFSSVKKMMFVK